MKSSSIVATSDQPTLSRSKRGHPLDLAGESWIADHVAVEHSIGPLKNDAVLTTARAATDLQGVTNRTIMTVRDTPTAVLRPALIELAKSEIADSGGGGNSITRNAISAAATSLTENADKESNHNPDIPKTEHPGIQPFWAFLPALLPNLMG